MITKRVKNIIAVFILGGLLCIGLGKLALNSSAPAENESSETSMHYKLPQLVPTSWIGHK